MLFSCKRLRPRKVEEIKEVQMSCGELVTAAKDDADDNNDDNGDDEK